MRYELSLEVFWQFELRREDVDVVEPWHLISIVKTEAVRTISLCVRIVPIDGVVASIERVLWH